MLARLELEPKRPQFAYASWPLPLLNYRAKRREALATASANHRRPCTTTCVVFYSPCGAGSRTTETAKLPLGLEVAWVSGS